MDTLTLTIILIAFVATVTLAVLAVAAVLWLSTQHKISVEAMVADNNRLVNGVLADMRESQMDGYKAITANGEAVARAALGKVKEQPRYPAEVEAELIKYFNEGVNRPTPPDPELDHTAMFDDFEHIARGGDRDLVAGLGVNEPIPGIGGGWTPTIQIQNDHDLAGENFIG